MLMLEFYWDDYIQNIIKNQENWEPKMYFCICKYTGSLNDNKIGKTNIYRVSLLSKIIQLALIWKWIIIYPPKHDVKLVDNSSNDVNVILW